MLKVLHTADIHPRDKDYDELKKCLSFTVMVAQSENIDLSIIAGDTFSLEATNKIDSPVVKLIIETISGLADIGPVFIIEGTTAHDGAAPEILQFIKGKYPVHVTTMPEQLYIKQLDVVLTLIPTPTKQFFQTESGIAESNAEIAMAMNGLFAGFGAQAHEYDCPHILVGHWNVSGSILPTGQVMTGKDIDIGLDQMMLACPDLIALGHIHLRQQIGDRAFYSGSLYPLNWGENTEHGFYIHELDGKKLVESRFIETPCKRLVRFQTDFTNPDNVTHVMTAEEVAGAYVRYDITVWQDEAAAINKSDIEAYAKELGAIDIDIRIIRIPRETVRSESVLKVNTLRDKIKAMAELRGETVSESILAKADILEFGERKEQVAA
jgi:DNA repair exonuclease SbcCD nuclease subunit